MPMYRLQKVKRYPNVHVKELKFQLFADSSQTGYGGTIIPIIAQDEGLGDPNSKYTNPESASFSETNEANCYPDSRVNYAKLNLEMKLSKGAVETDKARVLKVLVAPIYTSFLENLTAKDEVSTEEVEDILELQHETTDRQTYPLFNGNKLNGDHVDLGTNQAGLTTNTNIEGVTFDVNKLYDCLQFYTNGKKVKKSIGKLKWMYLSRDKILRMSFRIKSKTKAINPYTFFGLLIHVPAENSRNQLTLGGDLTAIAHVDVRAAYRYNEWNENFNAMR
jgi:hypothetical protein